MDDGIEEKRDKLLEILDILIEQLEKETKENDGNQ
jgi:hypothetical protein